MQFDWMIQGEKIREKNNTTVADYDTLLEQEKEKVEAEEAADEARRAAEAAALEAAQNGTDTDATTNEIGGEADGDNDAVAGVAEALAAVDNGDAAEDGFQITTEDIDKLSELHPENDAIGGLQDALRALLEDGQNIGDLPGELQDQVKDLLGLNKDKAMEGSSLSEDQDLLKNINDQLLNGGDAAELFEQELLKEAQEIYGEAELVSEETAEDGTITKKFKAADGTEFSLIETNKDGLTSVGLNLDDGSSIGMSHREGQPNGVGMSRHGSADEETGVMDFTFVNLDVTQEGTSRHTTDENGEAMTINNYTQTHADGSVREDVTSEFFADGTNSTRWEDEEGIGHLVIANDDFSGYEEYTSADGYQTATKASLSTDENGEAKWLTSTEPPNMEVPSLVVLDESESARRDQMLTAARGDGFDQMELDRFNNKVNNLAVGEGGIDENESKLLNQDAIAITSGLAAKNENSTMTLDEFLEGNANNPLIMQQNAQYMASLEEALAEDLNAQLEVFQGQDTDLARASAVDVQTQIETANRLNGAYNNMNEGLEPLVEELQIDFGGIDESAAQTMLQEQVALKQDLQSQLNQFQAQDTDLARASAADVTVQLAMTEKIISELSRQFP